MEKLKTKQDYLNEWQDKLREYEWKKKNLQENSDSAYPISFEFIDSQIEQYKNLLRVFGKELKIGDNVIVIDYDVNKRIEMEGVIQEIDFTTPYHYKVLVFSQSCKYMTWVVPSQIYYNATKN